MTLDLAIDNRAWPAFPVSGEPRCSNFLGHNRMTSDSRLKAAQSLRKQGRVTEALDLLREGIRRGELDAEGVERAGRFILRELGAGVEGVEKPLRVLLLGQCTTSWLVPSLAAEAWGHGVAALVTEGGFDNVLQDLAGLVERGEAPDVITLLPWSARLLDNNGLSEAEAEDRVADEVAFWQGGVGTGGPRGIAAAAGRI